MATLIKTITDALGNIILPRTRAEAVTLEDGVTTIQDVVDTADAHYANTSNPHSTTAVQVGADPTGTASTAVSNHVAASDPHTQYLKENPTASEVGALPMPDAGNYFPGDDTLGTQMQSVGSQLAQIPTNGAVMTNLVKNGDFSNGTTGWIASNSTLSATNNTLTVTGNGGSGHPRAQSLEYYTPAGLSRKTYVRFSARVTNSNCLKIDSFYDLSSGGGGFGSSLGGTAISSPAINTWYKYSSILSNVGSVAGIANVGPVHSYPDAATANGKVMEVKYVLALDLTAIFGAGNEPTAAQMDELLAFYDNSWFNGNANITDLLQYVVSRKANIAQEAWIAPTLLNSWANNADSNYDVAGYFKTTVKTVMVKGVIQGGASPTVAFVLATGYRPSKRLRFIISASSTALGMAQIETDGSVIIYAPITTFISLNGISFNVS